MPALPPPQAVNAGCEVNSEALVSVCPQDLFLLYSQPLTPPIHPRDPPQGSRNGSVHSPQQVSTEQAPGLEGCY